MGDAEAVLEPRVRRAVVDEVARPQLVQLAQALELRGVDYGHARRLHLRGGGVPREQRVYVTVGDVLYI